MAEQLGVERDKAWPKSARWLWKLIKEVLPLLVTAGIDASREHTDKGTAIALRKVPKSNVSNVREDKSGGDPHAPLQAGRSGVSATQRSRYPRFCNKPQSANSW